MIAKLAPSRSLPACHPHPLGVRVESGRGERPCASTMILYGSNRTVQYHRVRSGCMPLWRAFLPCRKRGVLCLVSAVLEKASGFPGPIRAVAALGGLDGESPLFRARPARPNQGGRSAQAACLVLTLICARLPWIPFAQFGFAFARDLPVRVCPFGGASASTLYSVSKGQTGASMDIQSSGRRQEQHYCAMERSQQSQYTARLVA